MNARQIVSLGVIGGICAAICALFYRRHDFVATISNASPVMSAVMAVTILILVLAIGLATPIEAVEISIIFNAILIVWGVVLASYGGLGHFYDPGYSPAAHKTPPQPFLARKIGVLYISVGIQCLVTGFMKTTPLALLIQIVIIGWGSALLYLARAFRILLDEPSNDLKKSPQSEDESNEISQHQSLFPDREASLRTPEFYFNISIPILFLTLYIFGDHE